MGERMPDNYQSSRVGKGGGRGGYNRDREYDRDWGVVDMTVAATATAGEEAARAIVAAATIVAAIMTAIAAATIVVATTTAAVARVACNNFFEALLNGRIAVLKEGFGFIDCADEAASQGGTAMKAQHFFSMSSILGRENPRIGDEVRYFVEVDRRSGKDAAVRVEILPPGTLPPPPKPPEVDLQGVIESISRNAGRLVAVGEEYEIGMPTEGGTAYHLGPTIFQRTARLSTMAT